MWEGEQTFVLIKIWGRGGIEKSTHKKIHILIEKYDLPCSTNPLHEARVVNKKGNWLEKDEMTR